MRAYSLPMRYVLILLLLTACTDEANHLAMNPAEVITQAGENVAYAARRSQVKTYLQANAQSVRAGEPGALIALWDIARTPEPVRAEVARDLARIAPGPGWSEYATLAVMARS